ncbi:MAG TPA: ParA family protein [Azospirillum sp.]
MKILLVLGPKGGVGKTTLVRNLAVAAALSGLHVAVLDTDRQRTLSKWLERRPDSLMPIQLYHVPFKDITSAPEAEDGIDLLIIDTPASVEDHPKALRSLVEAATYILLPSGVRGEEMDSLRETLTALRPFQRPMGVVLNATKPQLTETKSAHRALSVGISVAPASLPDLAEVHRTYDAGIGVVELRGAKTAQAMWDIWRYTAEALGIGA